MLALMFAGQGSQGKGMGVEVFGRYPGLVHFASEVLGYDLVSLCAEDPENLLGRTEYTQPALYVVNALRTFERMHQEDPSADFYLGHSLGEYNALLAAGVFDFETGLRLVAKRGELMAAASDGGMTAVMNTPAEQLRSIFSEDDVDGIDIAGFNTGSQLVIAATPPQLTAAHAALERRDIRFVPLKVSAPFHSRYMEPARVQFAEFIEQFSFSDPITPVISNVTARPYEPGQVARLLTEQLVTPVRWTDSIRALLDNNDGVEFAEIGGFALSQMVFKIKTGA
ncbi:ACP S-malonyltransferase [Streptomyces sp. WZ-12]|uniref:ACP S-malonyltransferase n=1 Tax=Streptomyces sp. WZ-12 TaxID=3030210 RepID=UPI0023819156|nr:ACP S-malonyltransferase [Streptomyces sp. WZ-12]